MLTWLWKGDGGVKKMCFSEEEAQIRMIVGFEG
jgi:hypothetical protein